MTDYKLVPVERLKDWHKRINTIAIETAFDVADEMGAMLEAAAPAVQGEPVAYLRKDHLTRVKRTGPMLGEIADTPRTDRVPVYAAPQPAEQRSSAGDSLTSVPDEVFAAEFAAWWDEHGQFCRAGGGTYERSFAFEAWRHLYPQLMNLQMAAAEQQREPCHECGGNGAGGEHEEDCSQQSAPDVAQLVEALESAKNLIANHSGEALPDAYARDQIEQIEAALAELEAKK